MSISWEEERMAGGRGEASFVSGRKSSSSSSKKVSKSGVACGSRRHLALVAAL